MARLQPSDKREGHEAHAAAFMRRAELAQANGDLEEAESLFREALAACDAGDTERSRFLALSGLGEVLMARGAFDDAREVLAGALALADAGNGSYDDERPLLLNELARLYLRQSAYDEAAPLLARLLVIKERQLGSGHPEVATVLASLASARMALGDHASAEDLYRQALAIRERSLPPNHITSATTMEALAEACAARGQFAEALSYSRRALTMREATLGMRDASVRAARERIADLQLQAPEAGGGVAPLRATPGSQPACAEPERARIVGASRLPMVLVPTAAELTDIERETLEPGALTAPARISAVVAGKVQSKSLVGRVAVLAAIVVVATLAMALQLRKRPAPAAFAIAEPDRAVARPDSQAPPPADTHSLASQLVARAAALLPRAEQAQPRAEPAASRPQPAAGNTAAPPLPRAIVPPITIPDIGAPVNVAGLAARPLADSFPDRLAPVLGREGAPRAGDSERAPTAPRLIGSAPVPRYPDRLRDLRVEGEVLVQFTVNENGRADAGSMQVVRSPHALLTEAVRAVLPQFRFEPARTAPPDARPRAETVKYAFTFNVPR